MIGHVISHDEYIYIYEGTELRHGSTETNVTFSCTVLSIHRLPFINGSYATISRPIIPPLIEATLPMLSYSVLGA